MINKIKNTIADYRILTKNKDLHIKLGKVFQEFASFTMIPRESYIDNLLLSLRVKELRGDIVECGVWRGGMIAGIAKMLGKDRNYYLFDSFEGLPEAKAIDGEAALSWQKNIDSPGYYDNCKAEIDFARKAMELANVPYECIKGWFNDTLPTFHPANSISLLRLDADWYDSTMTCLKYLYPQVVNKGIILIDDYYFWDGCSKAVHDYLSEIRSPSRIYSSPNGVAYIVKDI
jgi:O-methyltransferase